MLHLIEKAENNHDLTREELILLLEDTGCSEELFAAADRVRKNMSAMKFICGDLSNSQTSAATTAVTAGCGETIPILKDTGLMKIPLSKWRNMPETWA